jgi:hypothetical protein
MTITTIPLLLLSYSSKWFILLSVFIKPKQIKAEFVLALLFSIVVWDHPFVD